MECLDESTILALVQGSLPNADALLRRRHLADCDDCRALVAAVARSFRSAGTDPRSGTAFATTEVAWGSSQNATARDEERFDHLDDRAFMERLATGTLLDGRYRIERVLGAGGMGVVALATHVALGQAVAIKLLHPRSLASAEVVARFVREAQAAVRVASDHVVRVLDVASLPTGEPYIAMEYLLGRDAREHLSHCKRLEVSEVIDLVAQACLGVGRAHRAGIVHRDLKPANLFVIDAPGRDPSAPFLVKVLDFGVSKIRRDEIGAEEVSLTRSTAFLGTPLYMSPEQIRASRDVDARADVWALGCIIYELLVGKAPFRRESLGLTCAAILLEDVEALSKSRTDVPRVLEAIVTRCLAKDRAARFADGFDLAAALAPHAAKATRAEIERVVGVDARPTSPQQARAPWTRRVAIGLSPLVLLAAVLAARSWTRRGATQPPPTKAAAAAESVTTSAPASSLTTAAATSAPAIPSASTAGSVKLVAAKRPIASTSASSSSAEPTPAPSPSVVASVSAPLNPEFGPRK